MKITKSITARLLFAALLVTGFNNASAQVAQSEVNSKIEELLNWAQNTYPDLFPTSRNTQVFENWRYRSFPSTGLDAGIYLGDSGTYQYQGVYVRGGPFGRNPVYQGTLEEFLSLIPDSGTSSSIAACDTADAPIGFNYSQSGDVVNVWTDGCIKVSDTSSNLCEVPEAQVSRTGISVLTTSTTTSSEFSGIEISLPIFDLDSFVNYNSTICTINAPEQMSNVVVNYDMCLELDEDMFLTLGQEDIITVTPPITYSGKSTSTSRVVSDCFATDAESIVDVYTGEVWINQGGAFVQIAN